MAIDRDIDIDNLADEQSTPSRGSLLVASPRVGDPCFVRSVVAMVDNDSEGSMGIIVNRPLAHTLRDVLPDWLADNDFQLFLGGPLHTDSLFFLHSFPPEVVADSVKLKQGLYFGGNERDVRAVLERLPSFSNSVKFFLGYSGWVPSQLAHEIGEGDWAVTREYDAESMLIDDNELWGRVVDSFGGRYRHWHEWPIAPSSN